MVIQFSYYFLVSLTICMASTSNSQNKMEEKVELLAEINNKLAFNLYHQLESQFSENIFFSPLSLSTAFGMLYYGTRGTTAKDLRHFLGYEATGLSKELVHRAFQCYLTQTLPSQDPNAYVLSYANSALLQENLHVYSSYKKGIQSYYQASVKEVDFENASAKVIQEVNKWVKDKTNGKIDKLLDTLDPSTVFVLLNAIYFKGTWKTKFDASKTQPHTFYNKGLVSDTKEIPMMILEEEFPFITDHELKVDVIEMPYKGENISMIILLPYEICGIKSLEKSLSLEKFEDMRSGFYKTKMLLMLPKFKIKYSKDMASDFIALGASSVFSPDADFSGMTKKKNIYVSHILHKAVLEVNEEGSEASAVTGMITSRMSPKEIIVDHPFLFAIVDKRTDMILFLGRVNNL